MRELTADRKSLKFLVVDVKKAGTVIYDKL